MKSRHIYFVGIGGIGMSAIAQLLLQKGNRISGSDLKASPTTECLKGLGAQIYLGHRRENLKDIDAVVYSSAIKADNPELKSAQERNIPVFKRAQILQEMLQDAKAVTVAGAHGKTTTTAMVSCLLTHAGLNPTVAAGGVVCSLDKNAWMGDGRYFVAELDESDGSFLFFHPFISVLTNIDYEHVDYYGNWQNILSAYEKFIYQTQQDGVCIGCGDDRNIRNILEKFPRKKIFFGLSPENEVHAADIRLKGFSSEFTCFHNGKKLGELNLNVPGRHNISNCLAAVCCGMELGVDFGKIKEGLALYKGVERRFQIRHKLNGITIVEDYGHHPTEIKVTLEAAKGLQGLRRVVVFQPHRYTRTKFLLDEFGKCFADSDYLIITDIYAASEPPIEGLSAKDIVEKVSASGHRQVRYIKKEEIIAQLLKIIRPKDLVIFLGAGDIGKMTDELAQAIKKNS